jgi:putative ABC transport system permease protein
MQDIRFTLRSLTRSPGFAVLAIVTLALGIGANSAIFSVLNGVLLQPLPYPAPDRIAWVDEAHDGPSAGPGPVPWSNLVDWRAATTRFEALAGFGAGPAPVLGGDRPVSLTVAYVSEDFWRVFPVTPVAGRLTAPEEHVEGGPGVVVVSTRYRDTHMGGAPDLVGRVIEVAGRSLEVIGIAPTGFHFPSDADLWSPLEFTAQALSRTAHNHRVVGRLADGATLESADAELDRISTEMVAGLPDDDYDIEGAIVQPLRERVAGNAREPLTLLMIAAGMVLLIASTNLASSLLARGAARTQELAVRASLGAGRARLVRQLVTEGAVLSAAGGAVGLLLAFWVLRVLQALGAESIPRIGEVGIDPAVLLFTLGAVVVTTVLCGLLPALRLSSDGLASALRSGSRGNARGRGTLWRVLVGAEVALALLLLAGGGLLMRSVQEILAVDAGFEIGGLATVSTQLSGDRYPELQSYSDFYQGLADRLEARPEIASFAISNAVPFGRGLSTGSINLNGDPEAYVSPGTYVAVSPGYFDVLGIPILRGRDFTDADRDPDGEHVVIVSEDWAARAWPGEDPIGKTMTGGGMDNYWDQTRWATVVGVVDDVKYYSLTDEPSPAYYFPIYQRPFRSRFGFHVSARATGGDALDAAEIVRAELAELEPTVPLSVRTMRDRVSASVAERQFVLAVLGAFALLALVLAGVGIYGVVAWHVASREREMGIRLALGETPASVRAAVVRHALVMVAGGLLVGAVGALFAGRLVRSFLFGVAPADPWTLGGVALLLCATAVGAAWLPALRATRVDPIQAMRAD